MNLMTLNFEELESDLKKQLSAADSQQAVENISKEWLSKEGLIKSLFKQLQKVEDDIKPQYAKNLNRLKSTIEDYVRGKQQEFSDDKIKENLKSEYYDLSLPSNFSGLGSVHPVTKIERRIASILRPFGFKNVLGPEVESEYYCFDALNIPPHHPARDMQDTFYTDNGLLLRTHTTSVQARVLEECSKLSGQGLPIKVASFGRTYRNETEDASHQAMFHQFELVWLDEGLTLANLMALIQHILKELYGKRRRIRFVPKFYPYTEPSLGPQIDCTLCKAQGCAACGGAAWVTVGGSGMVHRKVLQEFNYDPEKVNGFAFGLGTSRLAAQMCNIPKLKMVYDNDLRILKGLI